MAIPLKKVTQEDPVIRIAYRAGRIFSRYFDVSILNLEHIPPKGGVMLVGNHAFMGVDTWALVPELFAQLRRVPRGMALRSLFKMPVIGEALHELGMVSGERDSAIELLQDGELVLTYPGGARDSLKGRAERYQLQWDGRHGFAYAAIQGQAPIVPIVGVGPDECFPIQSKRGLIPTRGLSGSSLKLPLFLPILRRVPFDFHVGQPLTPPELDEGASPLHLEEAAQDYASEVRRATQALLDEAVRQREDDPERGGGLSSLPVPFL